MWRFCWKCLYKKIWSTERPYDSKNLLELHKNLGLKNVFQLNVNHILIFALIRYL
jgi:hypothetical protein